VSEALITYNTGHDAQETFEGSTWLAQTFTVGGSPIVVTSAKVYVRTYNGGGQGYMYIKAVDGDGKPTGSVLGTASVTWPTGWGTYHWIEGTFSSSINLSAGTEYALIIRRVPTADIIYWRYDSSASSYTDGHRCTSINSGSSWTVDSNSTDFMFEIWGDTATPPGKAKLPAPADDEEGVYIHGIDKITELTWVNPDGEYPEYHIYFKYPGDEDWNDFGATGLTRYYTIDNDMRELLDYFSIYQWRVDTYDPETELTTTGDTWTFISDKAHSYTTFSRRSDYDPDKVWEPGTGWVDINSFEYTGGGRYKGRLVILGHNCIYFGSL